MLLDDSLTPPLKDCEFSYSKNVVLGSNFKPCSIFMLKTTPKFLITLCEGIYCFFTTKQYSPKTPVVKSGEEVRIAVLGASSYTGAEIVQLLPNRPQFRIRVMTADRKAGEQFVSVFPHLITQDLPDLVAIKDADFTNVDAVFCCLPHGTTQKIIKGLPQQLKIVDLSAGTVAIRRTTEKDLLRAGSLKRYDRKPTR